MQAECKRRECAPIPLERIVSNVFSSVFFLLHHSTRGTVANESSYSSLCSEYVGSTHTISTVTHSIPQHIANMYVCQTDYNPSPPPPNSATNEQTTRGEDELLCPDCVGVGVLQWTRGAYTWFSRWHEQKNAPLIFACRPTLCGAPHQWCVNNFLFCQSDLLQALCIAVNLY